MFKSDLLKENDWALQNPPLFKFLFSNKHFYEFEGEEKMDHLRIHHKPCKENYLKEVSTAPKCVQWPFLSSYDNTAL